MKHVILSVLLFWTTVVSAQNIKYAVSVSKSKVATGEQFEVTLAVNGNIEKFAPPEFDGLQVLSGPNQSSSMTAINGNTTVSMSLSYIVAAVKEGEYTIGSSIVVVNGKQYRSNPIKVVAKGKVVSQNTTPSDRDSRQNHTTGNASNIAKRLFIRAVANKTNVYQGEQLAVTYKLYSNVDLVDNSLDKLPDFNGFWSQEIKNSDPNVRWETETFNGTRYNVAVLKEIILFPERSGKLKLDPLAMTFVARLPVASNDPFEAFFGGAYDDVKYKIKSSPVSIYVKPLPENGKPPGFQGAVGNFAIEASVDKAELKANEALNYQVKISGSGNLKLLKAPELNLAADIEKYDPKVADHIIETLNGVSGSREYTYLLIPRHEGKYTIDPLNFSYFNPATQRYVTLSSKAFKISVAKGLPGSNVTALSSVNQQDVKLLASDLRYIKTSGDLHKSGAAFYGSVSYYLLLCSGPLLFLLAFGYRRWHRENNKDQVLVKSRNANKIALKHLENAEKQLIARNKPAFYEAIYKGLYGYLSDKLNIGVADLNMENIREQLKLRAVNEAQTAQLIETLDLCEMARYAPISGISEQEVFDKAKNIIHEIETNA